MKIDLSVDIAEGSPHDAELLQFASSASICCAEHAGDRMLTERTIRSALSLGKRIGAHPGFPDRQNFGRNVPDNVNTYLRNLIEQVDRFCAISRPSYLKPHGALYNIVCGAAECSSQVRALCESYVVQTAKDWGLAVMILPASSLVGKLKAEGIQVILEGFADRAYNSSGQLRARTEPGALLDQPEEITSQVLRLAHEVDSICIHGDGDACVETIRVVHDALVAAGYEIGP